MAVSAAESSKKKNDNSSQNNTYRGGSTYNKNGTRIDYEYNGTGSGNVHYHGTKGKEMLWTLNDGIEKTHMVAKTISVIINSPQIQKAISRAQEIVISLSGLK